MKIHIIGGSGSGKTHLARALSEEYGIPHYDLDELQWDNSSNAYGRKRAREERGLLLDDILKNPDWIYLLSVPRYKYRYRIIRRFVRRKLGLEKGKKESLKSVAALLRWADKYQKEDMAEIRRILAQYPEKVISI